MSIRWITIALFLCLLPTICLAVTLPQEHEYQQQLRVFMATLKEEDFAVEIKPFTVAPGDRTPDDRFKAVLLSSSIPQFGTGLLLPPAQFTLAAIEGQDGIMLPQVNVDALSWLATWNYSGNPYFGSRAVKLRTFVAGAVDLIMHDHLHEQLHDGTRSDYLGGTLIWLAYAYKASRDVLPPAAGAAYADGLKKMVRRLNEWGPTGLMTDMDLFTAVSMRLAADQVNDPEITKIAEAYVKRLYTDPHFFHPAGYFVDNGCFDTSYNGISLYFTTFAALQAQDWTFIRDALDKAYRLKSYLSFPEPDGTAYGPSQCSSRTSADPPNDQWNFPNRNPGAAMLTDHALFLLPKLPPPDQLAKAEEKLVAGLNAQVNVRNYKPAEAKVWIEHHWCRNINYAYDFYADGFYAKRARLEAENSPLLQNPFLREGDFIENFADAFLVAKLGDYACAIHTGPVGPGIFGWGGGELCAFWTRNTGAVMLGRRRGWAKQTGKPELSDSFGIWRTWPVHAVTGITAEGNIFSSARIRNPESVYTIAKDRKRAEVRVSGVIPRDPTNTDAPCLQGEVKYARTFTADPSGLTITTTLTADGKDKVTELYETLPVFLNSGAEKGNNTAKISFKTGDEWIDATPDPRDNVHAVRITRYTGTVLITFAKPARVKLSPEVWSDHYQSKVNCRTILIDLLNNNGQPTPIPAVSVTYTIGVEKER